MEITENTLSWIHHPRQHHSAPVNIKQSTHRSVRQTLSTSVLNVKDTEDRKNQLDQSWLIKYQHLLIIFSIFTYLVVAIVVSVLTVYFVLQKSTNRTCYIAFQPTAQRATRYDSRPHQISMGDFNQDHHLDLVVANSGTDNIGIFLNSGNGTFHNQWLVSAGIDSQPYAVVVGTFNNDTKLDIVVAHYGLNSIGVYLGDGNGNFSNHSITSLHSSRPLSLAAGDFNNDSILDIAVVNDGTLTVVILVGFNNGSFQLNSIYDMGYDSIPYSIAVGDLNEDRMVDLVIANYGTSELVILLNDGNESFVMDKYFIGNASHPVSIAINDLNNDKKLDIVTANSATSNIEIFLGNGDGTFRSYVTYWVGSNSRPQSVAINDVNNDTLLDIFILDSETNNVVVFKGNGNGNFSVMITHSTGINSQPLSMVVGDFDNDDKLDTVIANNATNNILLLRSFLIYLVPTYTSYLPENDSASDSIDAGDFNEDGHLDLIISDHFNENIYIYLNLGNQTFHKTQTYYTGEYSYPYFVISGDVNNDYHLDIVVVLQGIDHIKIFLGIGDGTFKDGRMYSTEENSETYTAALNDLNNDGNLDIIVSNYKTGNIGIFFGFGNGTFTDIILLLTDFGYHPKCLGVDDFNNDKILDIAVANSKSNTIAILFGYGNGSFENPLINSIDSTVLNCIGIGDVNHDNRPDIIYIDDLFSHLSILLGHGNGTFRHPMKYLISQGYGLRRIAVGYYNNDALYDIVVTNSYDRSISILLGIGDGLFDTSIRLSKDYNFGPQFAAFVDFNKDNQQEILIAGYGAESITILAVNYEANFINESSYSTGSGPHPYATAVQDLNNDGKSDLVIVNAGNHNIELLFSYNKGTFINKTILSTGDTSHPQSITIGDFNKDQLLDIAVLNSWSDDMNIFLGMKNGSFDTTNVYPIGSKSFPNFIIADDLNRDGRKDVIIANQDADNVVVFLALDYIQFTSHIIKMSMLYASPVYIITADFNNDHQLDIAVSSTNRDQIAVYLGYGNGTFSEQIILFTGRINWPTGLDVGDFNNDDYLDIVAAYSGFSGIGLFLGYGNGSFHSQIFHSTSVDENSAPRSVAVADFNKDGKADIVVANNFDHNILILHGDGNGSFTEQIVYKTVDRSYPQWVSIADLNNDTFLDLIIANNDPSSVCILSGYDNGTFEHIITLSTGNESNPYMIDVGDLNKDNILDIVVVNQDTKNIMIFYSDNNGNYSLHKTYFTSSLSDLTSIVLCDVNNDTMLDILVVDYDQGNSSIAIFYGYGNGNFTLPKIYPTGINSQPKSIATGDFNNDNRIDLVMAYQNHGSIGIMLQLKSEPFASATTFSTGNHSRPKSVTIADFNHDNYLDLAVANSGTNTIGIFLGYGDGYFHEQFTNSTSPSSFPSALASGDFNNDHHIDIVVVNTASNNIMIFFGDGNGSFPNRTTYSTGIRSDPCSIAVADLDKNMYLDVVIANWGTNNVLVFLGNSDESLFELKTYPMGYNARPQSITIADINNDNLFDIIVANYGSDYVEILLQTCSFYLNT